MMKSITAIVLAALSTAAALATAQTTAPSAPASKAEVKASAAAEGKTKDATGKTEANREGKMSPTGQNETSSTAPQKGVSSTTGTSARAKREMGEAGGNTKDATGKTQANREGKMSPTGQNETSSTATKQTSK